VSFFRAHVDLSYTDDLTQNISVTN